MPCVFPCPGVEGACAGHVGDGRETQHASHGAWGDVQPETSLGYPMVDGGCRADVVAFTLGKATVLCVPGSLYIESWAGVGDEMLFYEMDKPQNESPSPHLLSTEYIHAREVSSF